MAVVKEWRKRQKRGGNADTEFPEALLDPKNAKRKEYLSANPVGPVGLKKGRKRQAKDAKYGSGGAKRFKKTNDVDSASDMSGFSRRKNAVTQQRPTGFPKSPQNRSGGGGFGQRPKKVISRRPGKANRQRGK